MIRLINVNKKYGKKFSLNNVNLHIQEGEIFGLIGPNGSGKSTLLSIIATILKPTSGEIYMNNRNIVENPHEMRRWIGYVPQDIALYPMLSVWDNLRFWAQLAPGKVTKERLQKIAEVVNLSNSLKEIVQTLSGGMKRKLNMAVAMLHDPKILIMDEPTVGIDILSKRDIVSYIKELRKNGVTIVYSTHDFQEIQYLCDRIGVLNNGILEFTGRVEEGKRLGYLTPFVEFL